MASNAVRRGQPEDHGQQGSAKADHGGVEQKAPHGIAAEHRDEVFDRGLEDYQRRNRRVLQLRLEGGLDHPGEDKEKRQPKEQQQDVETRAARRFNGRMAAPGPAVTLTHRSNGCHYTASEAARRRRMNSRLVPMTRTKKS